MKQKITVNNNHSSAIVIDKLAVRDVHTLSILCIQYPSSRYANKPVCVHGHDFKQMCNYSALLQRTLFCVGNTLVMHNMQSHSSMREGVGANYIEIPCTIIKHNIPYCRIVVLM